MSQVQAQPTKQATEYILVMMKDGSKEEFTSKRRLNKYGEMLADGSLSLTFKWKDGEIQNFTIAPERLAEFAVHGALQKYGDQGAGLKELDDQREAIEELHQAIKGGRWNVGREGAGGMAGASILVKALVELTGKTPEKVREFLADKTQGEKLALRKSAKVAPIVTRLEQERDAKRLANGVEGFDTDAALAGLLEAPANSVFDVATTAADSEQAEG